MPIWTNDPIRVHVIALIVGLAHDDPDVVLPLIDRLGPLLGITVADTELMDECLYPDYFGRPVVGVLGSSGGHPARGTSGKGKTARWRGTRMRRT